MTRETPWEGLGGDDRLLFRRRFIPLEGGFISRGAQAPIRMMPFFLAGKARALAAAAASGGGTASSIFIWKGGFLGDVDGFAI